MAITQAICYNTVDQRPLTWAPRMLAAFCFNLAYARVTAATGLTSGVMLNRVHQHPALQPDVSSRLPGIERAAYRLAERPAGCAASGLLVSTANVLRVSERPRNRHGAAPTAQHARWQPASPSVAAKLSTKQAHTFALSLRF